VIELLGVVGAALGTGLVSAVFPLVNAEAATVAVAWGLDVPTALAAVAGIALGQTAGKVVVYESARAGGDWGRRWRARRGRDTPRDEGGASRVGARLRALGRRLMDAMGPRWRTAAVLVLSATVGLPPLLATAVAAGVLRTRRLDFALCVAIGRLARFGVIAWPVIAATQG
jgi:membrane protein YqaA with SNARE-associated domain